MRKTIKISLLILMAINALYVLSGVLNYQIRSVDVYSIWLFKSKAFWLTDGIPVDIMNEYSYSHPQYPILLPWIFSFLSSAIGSYKEIYLLSIYPLIYLLILYISCKTIKKLGLSDIQARIFTYLYSMLSPLLAQAGRGHAGTADIFITLFGWIIISIFIDKKYDKKQWLLVTALLVMFASQIKTEGALLATIFLFTPVGWKKRFIYIFLSTLPAVIWVLLVPQLGLVSDLSYSVPSFIGVAGSTYDIIRATVIEMLNINNWYIFWPIFWLLIATSKSKDHTIKTVINPTLLTMVFGIMAAYLLESSLNTFDYATGSLDRLMLQTSPFFYMIFVERSHEKLQKILKFGYNSA